MKGPRWRIIMLTKGKEVWYEAEVRLRVFWRGVSNYGYTEGEWASRSKFDSPDKAQAAAMLVLERNKVTLKAVLREGDA